MMLILGWAAETITTEPWQVTVQEESGAVEFKSGETVLATFGGLQSQFNFKNNNWQDVATPRHGILTRTVAAGETTVEWRGSDAFEEVTTRVSAKSDGAVRVVVEAAPKVAISAWESLCPLTLAPHMEQAEWAGGAVRKAELADGSHWSNAMALEDRRWVAFTTSSGAGFLVARSFSSEDDGVGMARSRHRLFKNNGQFRLEYARSHVFDRPFLTTRRVFSFRPFAAGGLKSAIAAVAEMPEVETDFSLVTERRALGAEWTSRAPVVDGNLEPKEWASVPTQSDFWRFDWNDQPKVLERAEKQTTVQAIQDGTALYLAFRCADPHPEAMKVTHRKSSPQVWQDESIEIRLRPTPESPEFQFNINPHGAAYDNQHRSGEWQAAAQVTAEGWSCEVRIPFTLLGRVPTEYEAWSFNVSRNHAADTTLSSWSRLYGARGFNHPEWFGNLLFGSPIVATRVTVAESVTKRSLWLAADLKNVSAKSAHSPWSLTCQPDDRGALRVAGELRLEAGAQQREEQVAVFPISSGYRTLVEVWNPAILLAYDRATFVKTGYSGLVSRLWPLEFGEERSMAQESVMPLNFTFANYSGKPQTLRLTMELPAGIDVWHQSQIHDFLGRAPQFPIRTHDRKEVVRDGKPWTRHAIVFERPLGPTAFEAIPVWLYTAIFLNVERPELGTFELRYRLEAVDGTVMEKEHAAKIQILPPFKGRQPQVIETGIDAYYPRWVAVVAPAVQQECATALYGQWARAGVNHITVGGGAAGGEEAAAHVIRDTAKGLGITQRWIFWWHWWNPEWLKAHPEDGVIKLNGTRESGDEARVCPMVLINTPASMQKALDAMRWQVEHQTPDGIFRDLEGPACFDICFCPRCIAAFQKKEQIAGELTPATIKVNHYAAWIRFCTWQTDQIEQRIKKAMRKVNPQAKVANFTGLEDIEVSRLDWKSAQNWLDLIGPAWYETSPTTLDSWAERTDQFAKRITNGKPIVTWLMHEFGVLTDHRLHRMQLVKSVADGFQGYTVYLDSSMLDGVRLHDLTIANTILADFEPFFLHGKRDTQAIKADQPERGWSMAPWVWDGQVAIFVFNHSPTTERTVTLTLRDSLPAGWEYLNDTPQAPGQPIRLTLPPLGMQVLYFGPSAKLSALQQLRRSARWQWVN